MGAPRRTVQRPIDVHAAYRPGSDCHDVDRLGTDLRVEAKIQFQGNAERIFNLDILRDKHPRRLLSLTELNIGPDNLAGKIT